METIEVSIICLTYNQSRYIRKCLESLVAQETTFKYEILVHDDASTDGTEAIVREIEKQFDCVKAYYEKENQYSKGVKVDQNLIDLSNGKYIAFCEGDDFWNNPYKLQKQYDALETNLDCTIATHKVQKVSEDGHLLKSSIEQKLFPKGIINGKDYLIKYLEGNNDLLLQTSSFFIRREFVVEKPIELQSFGVGDVPMMLWALYNGNMYYFDDYYSSYRVMSKGSTNRAMLNNSYALTRIIKNAEGFLAFNKLTNNEFFEAMKHRLSYYIVQSYYGTKGRVFVDLFPKYKKSITLKERLYAKLKFTLFGSVLRCIRVRISNIG